MSKINASDLDWGESLDAMFMDAFTKRVMMPITQYPAFKLRLIDATGNIKRQPKSREEKRALSFLDRLALLFKKYNTARIFQVYNDYRLARLNPIFLAALVRSSSMRFNRYYDLNYGWDFDQQNIMQEEKKQKRKKQILEERKRLQEQEIKKQKEITNQLQDFLIEMEEKLEEKEGD